MKVIEPRLVFIWTTQLVSVRFAEQQRQNFPTLTFSLKSFEETLPDFTLREKTLCGQYCVDMFGINESGQHRGATVKNLPPASKIFWTAWKQAATAED